MGVFMLCLVLFVQLQRAFSSDLVVDTGVIEVECLSYLSYIGGEVFYVNGKLVDKELYCKALKFYNPDRCTSIAQVCESSSGKREPTEKIRMCTFNLTCDYSLNSIVLSLTPMILRLRGSLQPPVELPGGRKLLQKEVAKKFIIYDLPNEKKEGPGFVSTPMMMTMGVPGFLLLCFALLCPCFRTRRKEDHSVLVKDRSLDSVSSVEVATAFEKFPPGSPFRVPQSPRFSMSPTPKLSRVGSVHLSVSQVAKATQNFSPALRIGEGGFGTVYKAQLPDGQFVAIKRARKEHFANLQTEFSSEVELLAKIDHKNLVKLLGYVDQGNERLIITEYVPNGTLRDHLDGLRQKILDFNQRLEIAIDIAHALTYLHLYAEKQIIHRDVKSSNILLTESLRPKVADFGFARLGPLDGEHTHILTKVKGTVGYLDPEYMRTYQLTPKSDVYSFGILLLEILTGRRPVELKRPADERVTLMWAFKKLNEGNVGMLKDPLMEEVVDSDILGKIFDLAIQCAAPTRADRPDMKQVGEQLWLIRADYLKSVRRG